MEEKKKKKERSKFIFTCVLPSKIAVNTLEMACK
jgi:hypothetical protein